MVEDEAHAAAAAQVWQMPMPKTCPDGRQLGEEPHMPVDLALRATLQGMDCLEATPTPPQEGKIMLCA